MDNNSERNCKYCSKKGKIEKFPKGLTMINCGARATLVAGDGSAAENCMSFPMYDARRSQDE